MTRLLQALTALALGVVCWVGIEVGLTVHTIRPKLAVTVSNIDRATIAAGAAASNVEKASRAWEAASKKQTSQTTKVLSNVDAAVVRFTSFVSKTDESLNLNFLPTLSITVREQNAALLESQKELQESLVEVTKATQKAQQVLVTANEQIANPAIRESVDNVATSTQNLATATHEAAATMTDIRKGVNYEVAELMKPVKKVKVVVLFLAQLAGKFLGY